MAGPTRIQRLQLPASRRRYGFSLTALADAMFQLLIFFMLSANLSSYALLDLRGGGIRDQSAPDAATLPEPDSAPPPATLTEAAETAIWSVHPDAIVSGGQRFGLDRLSELTAAMKAAGTPQVLLVTQDGVRVQTLVTVLEALAAGGIGSVQVASGEGAGS